MARGMAAAAERARCSEGMADLAGGSVAEAMEAAREEVAMVAPTVGVVTAAAAVAPVAAEASAPAMAVGRAAEAAMRVAAAMAAARAPHMSRR